MSLFSWRGRRRRQWKPGLTLLGLVVAIFGIVSMTDLHYTPAWRVTLGVSDQFRVTGESAIPYETTHEWAFDTSRTAHHSIYTQTHRPVLQKRQEPPKTEHEQQQEQESPPLAPAPVSSDTTTVDDGNTPKTWRVLMSDQDTLTRTEETPIVPSSNPRFAGKGEGGGEDEDAQPASALVTETLGEPATAVVVYMTKDGQRLDISTSTIRPPEVQNAEPALTTETIGTPATAAVVYTVKNGNREPISTLIIAPPPNDSGEPSLTTETLGTPPTAAVVYNVEMGSKKPISTSMLAPPPNENQKPSLTTETLGTPPTAAVVYTLEMGNKKPISTTTIALPPNENGGPSLTTETLGTPPTAAIVYTLEMGNKKPISTTTIALPPNENGGPSLTTETLGTPPTAAVVYTIEDGNRKPISTSMIAPPPDESETPSLTTETLGTPPTAAVVYTVKDGNRRPISTSIIAPPPNENREPSMATETLGTPPTAAVIYAFENGTKKPISTSINASPPSENQEPSLTTETLGSPPTAAVVYALEDGNREPISTSIIAPPPNENGGPSLTTETLGTPATGAVVYTFRNGNRWAISTSMISPEQEAIVTPAASSLTTVLNSATVVYGIDSNGITSATNTLYQQAPVENKPADEQDRDDQPQVTGFTSTTVASSQDSLVASESHYDSVSSIIDAENVASSQREGSIRDGSVGGGIVPTPLLSVTTVLGGDFQTTVVFGIDASGKTVETSYPKSHAQPWEGSFDSEGNFAFKPTTTSGLNDFGNVPLPTGKVLEEEDTLASTSTSIDRSEPSEAPKLPEEESPEEPHSQRPVLTEENPPFTEIGDDRPSRGGGARADGQNPFDLETDLDNTQNDDAPPSPKQGSQEESPADDGPVGQEEGRDRGEGDTKNEPKTEADGGLPLVPAAPSSTRSTESANSLISTTDQSILQLTATSVYDLPTVPTGKNGAGKPSFSSGLPVVPEADPIVPLKEAGAPPAFAVDNQDAEELPDGDEKVEPPPLPNLKTATVEEPSSVAPSDREAQPPPPPPLPPAETTTSREEEKPTKTSNLYDWVPSSTLLQNPSAIESEKEGVTPPGVDKPTLGVVPAPVPTFAEEPGKQAGKEEPKPDEETASETSSAKAALPSEWPSSIVPQQAAGETEDGEPSAPVGLAEAKNAPRTPDTSLISILLTSALSWQWLLTKSDASAQVFAYMPVLIATSLRIDESQVTTVSLEAWEPPNWSGDGADVRSVWVGHMPTAKVNELSELITNSSSPFYTEGKPIIRQLSSCVDPSLPLLSLQNSLGLAPDADPDAANGENDEGRMSNKKTAFVASAAALGAIILAVGAFFGSKYAMNRKAESAHSQRDDESYHSGSSRSFTSRSQEIPGYDTAAAPMEQMGGLARDSEYYGSQSDYPVTERDDMRDTYGRASTRPPTMPLPEPPEAYRDSYDSALAAPLVRNGQSSFYPTERSFINTARSGSGSSVQSEVIGSGRRQSSVDIPIRDTWWKHASQWGHQAGEVDNTRIQSVMSDPVPKSGRVISFDRPFSASSMSTLRTADGGAAFGSMGPFGNGNPFGNAPHGKPAKISGPYLQDNSLML